MARKNAHTYRILDAQSLTSDFTSTHTTIQYLDNVGIQLDWTGAPVGQFYVEVSNSDLTDPKITPVWSTLDFGVPIIINNTNTDHIINLFQVPFSHIRLRYEATSGTGSMNAEITEKQVGG